MSERSTVDDWAFSLVTAYAKRGTCIRRQAGALALDYRNRIIGVGMNGVPAKFPHCIDIPCAGATDAAGDTTNCYAIHAEVNMLINAMGDRDHIATVYITTTPCKTCALMLANLPGLKYVRCITRYADQRGIEILDRAGISVIIREVGS